MMKAQEYLIPLRTIRNYLRIRRSRTTWLLTILTFTSLPVLSQNRDTLFPYKSMPDVMPGTTKLLAAEGDRSQKMLDGAHHLIEEKIYNSQAGRAKFWNRNLSSARAYDLSVQANRKRFSTCIGAIDKNEPYD